MKDKINLRKLIYLIIFVIWCIVAKNNPNIAGQILGYIIMYNVGSWIYKIIKKEVK